MTDPKSCMKLQMGHATSLCLWKASGMTGCSILTPISFLSTSSQESFLNTQRNRRGSSDAHTMKQTVIHGHLEMQCADQFPPIILPSALRIPQPSLSLSLSLSLSPEPEQRKHTVMTLRSHPLVPF